MQNFLEGRVALVTGAGTGIGRATVRALAGRGARVLAVGRRSEPLAETAAGHDRIRPYPADITADAAADDIVSAVIDTYGRLDVLVNNAGIVRAEPLGALTAAAVDAQLATNLVAPMMLARAAVSALAETNGVIVNVSTSVGQRAWPGSSVYAATKCALEHLTRSWAVELAPSGVRVVAVAPGAVDTPIGEHQGLPPEQVAAIRDWQIGHTPLGRIGRAEEIAWMVVQLAAPEAAFVTGAVVPVDGGAVVA